MGGEGMEVREREDEKLFLLRFGVNELKPERERARARARERERVQSLGFSELVAYCENARKNIPSDARVHRRATNTGASPGRRVCLGFRFSGPVPKVLLDSGRGSRQ